MRCLTIRQPYPEAIVRGLKRWETRSYRTHYRGLVAIHAAQEWAPGWRNVWIDLDRASDHELERYEILTDRLGLEPVEDIHDPTYWQAWDGPVPLPTGAVVAVADLTDCVPIIGPSDARPIIDYRHVVLGEERASWESQSRPSLWAKNGPRGMDISDQLPYGIWTAGSWAWRLGNVVRLPEPIPVKGRLGLWNPYGHPLPHDPDGDLHAEILRALG